MSTQHGSLMASETQNKIKTISEALVGYKNEFCKACIIINDGYYLK